MQSNFSSFTPFKLNSQASTKLYPQLASNYPKSDYSKNQFRKYSEMSQSSQTSQNTPEHHQVSIDSNVPTHPFKAVNAMKLDFSSFGETEKKAPSQFLLQKLRNINSTTTENNMDIEVSPFSIEDTKKEKPPVKETTNFFQEILKNLTPPKKEDFVLEGMQKEEKDEDEVYPLPKQKEPTLIKRWKESDKIFEGKYSTGATPKYFKNTSIPPAYGITTLTRSNSDVPPTLESTSRLEALKESAIGNNKYLNNLKKNNIIEKPLPPIQNTIEKRAIEKFSSGSKNFFGQTSSSKKKFAKNLFADFNEEKFAEDQNDLSQIQEKTSEHDFLTKEMENEASNPVSRLLDFETECSRESEEEAKGLSQHENEETFHTPTKSPIRTEQTNPKFNPFSSMTMKKEPKSKLFSIFSNSTDVTDRSSMEIKPENPVLRKIDKQRPDGSRFTQDYDILEVLGSGYFGTVYKCQNKLDGLIYAIKCTHNKLKGGNNINQALNEAQALASLSALDENPFIVRYYNAWIEDDRLYLVMEHCQSNLKHLRNEHVKFSESMIRQIMRDICMGLRHLHKQRIVHLDIKPENILYSKTHKYKIADLGLSRIAHRSNGEDINEGDCRYLAPEVLNDFPENQLPDLTKADIFSFGATIYELMTGCDLPKNGPEWRDLRNGNLHKLDHLNYSNSLKSIIKGMMSSNPDHRPSAHELLTNFLQSEIELELKWEKQQNAILRKKVKELESKLGIQRKNSF